jgi:hypothetical protein
MNPEIHFRLCASIAGLCAGLLARETYRVRFRSGYKYLHLRTNQ